jgi:hypothetical protein
MQRTRDGCHVVSRLRGSAPEGIFKKYRSSEIFVENSCGMFDISAVLAAGCLRQARYRVLCLMSLVIYLGEAVSSQGASAPDERLNDGAASRSGRLATAKEGKDERRGASR